MHFYVWGCHQLSPKGPTCNGGAHLDHGVANRQGTEEGGEEKESQVEVPGGGNAKQSLWRFVQEVDCTSTAVEEEHILKDSHCWQQGTKEHSKPWGGGAYV